MSIYDIIDLRKNVFSHIFDFIFYYHFHFFICSCRRITTAIESFNHSSDPPKLSIQELPTLASSLEVELLTLNLPEE